MPEPQYADLHLHTCFSDGSYLPGELVEAACGAGLSAIAVTDHDTIEGVEPVREAAADTSLQVVAGTELSVRFEDEEVHLVGLFIDTDNDRLNQALDDLRKKRRQRIVKIAEKLQRFQIKIDPQEILETAGTGTVGRLHVAEMLLRKGITSSIAESFWKYLGDKAAAFVPKPDIDFGAGCELIHQAHGIAVLAHPGTQPDERRLAAMAHAGIDALEAYYPMHDDPLIRRYINLAGRFGLGISGGSDCHGQMKEQVQIGTVKLPMRYFDQLEKRAEQWA